MRIDLTKPQFTNFLSAGEDLKDIMFKILENKNILRLLKYTTPNALSSDLADVTDTEKMSMINNNIKIVPKLPIIEEQGSFIIILFDHFKPNASNQKFRDNIITFDIICDVENWIMDDYMLRPLKIMHEIDSMFNGQKLNGIGRVEFAGADSLILTSDVAGYSISYRVINDV